MLSAPCSPRRPHPTFHFLMKGSMCASWGLQMTIMYMYNYAHNNYKDLYIHIHVYNHVYYSHSTYNVRRHAVL